MYNTLKLRINSGSFNLGQMLVKIEKAYSWDRITDEQYEELVLLANQKANPDDAKADLECRIESVEQRILKLEDRISMLESVKESDKPSDDEGNEEVISDWYRWDGTSINVWNKGIRCIHNNKMWESQVDNNIWEPGALGVYSNIWKEISEGA